MTKSLTGEGTMNTLVGHGTTIEGTFNISSSIRIDGKITGHVTCSENLLVGKTGVLDASVKVKSATIGGKVKGDIEASEVVVLEGNCTMDGDVTTKKLIIEEGAIFNGTCHMGGDAPAKAAATGAEEVKKEPAATPQPTLGIPTSSESIRR